MERPEQATDKVVRLWMMGLMESGVGARSVNRKLSALRGFFRFARMVGDIDSEPTAFDRSAQDTEAATGIRGGKGNAPAVR